MTRTGQVPVAQAYDVYELAVLIGGAGRAVDVAVVELVETERVRVQRSGQLTVVRPAAAHPVEQQVLDALQAGAASTWQGLRTTLRQLPELEEQLRARGLLARTRWSRLLAAVDPERHHGAWSLTPAGRAACGRPLATAGVTGPSAWPVALGGVWEMIDPQRRQALLGLPEQVVRGAGRAGGSRRGWGSGGWGSGGWSSGGWGCGGSGGGSSCGGSGGGSSCGGGGCGGGGCGGGGCGGGG